MTYELFFTTLFSSKFYFPTKVLTFLGTLSGKLCIIYAPPFSNFLKELARKTRSPFLERPTFLTFPAESKHANENPKKTSADPS